MWRCGQLASPSQLLAQEVLPVPCQHKTSAREPLGEQDKGPGCSNPRQHRLCPASCSWADGLEPIPGTAALSPVDGPVLGAASLEPGSWG